jgi:putative membrane protein
VFLTKISLFGVAALLSIYPTVFFLKHRKGPEKQSVAIPKSLRLILKIELALILLIPLLAVLMARGVGLG